MSLRRILYGLHTSPPVRAVRMTFKALDLDYEFKYVNLNVGENRTTEFLKINPQHSVPTLVEADGKCIWDSHAIMSYLVRRYGKDDSLYPKDFYERALVDQRLHYENGALFLTLIKQMLGPLRRGQKQKEQLPEIKRSIVEAYELLETLLDKNDYMAGKSLTIADFSIVSTVSTIDLFVPIESNKYPKLNAWFERIKRLPYFDSVNSEGLSQWKEQLQAKLVEMK